MPIIDLQRRMRELGRIRTGQQVAAAGGKKRPSKLETFRLTSASRELLDAAAETYGGKVEPWPEQNEFQLITSVDAFDIVIPPGQAISQWYELWTGGGCQRRCDGVTNVITDTPCACPSDATLRREQASKGLACKPTTRINLILPALPDIGVWRLESHGYYAAVELAGTAEFLERASQSGRLLPARLRLDQREKKVPGQPVAHYAVPVIELPQTRIGDYLAASEAPAALVSGNGHTTELVAGAPAEKKRSAARQRVERPALGPAPEPPDGAGFTKTSAPLPDAEPERVAGWAVDDEPEAAVAGITREALLAELARVHISQAFAAERSKAMFPDSGPANPLTDVQRRTLLDALLADQAVAAL